MELQKCVRCKKRQAIVFISHIENGVKKTSGFCLPCAKQLGIKQVDEAASALGLSDEELEAASDELDELCNASMNGALEPQEQPGDVGAVPVLDFNKIFGSLGFPFAQPPQKKSDKNSGSGKGKESKKPEDDKKFLRAYATDLTEKARLGKSDRIVGRERELDRVIQILCRRQKNNPCLIGEPGVGKTAIAEAMAQRIVDGNVPEKLREAEIWLLDLTALVAGTQFRGQFESRILGLIKEVKSAGNVILMIDEVHTIVGAGDSEGSMSAANILKPALSRGEIQVIGATTLKEYRKYIEKDSALERRFQPVTVNEPSVEETVEVIRGIKKYYEDFHGVTIPLDVARKAVLYSERYITDRYLPDKAIDIIDEAASRVSLSSPEINEKKKNDKIILSLRKRVEELEAKLEKTEAQTEENYKALADVKVELMKLEKRQDELVEIISDISVSINDVAKVIEIWTGVPAAEISAGDIGELEGLYERISSKVIGQNEAVSAVVRAVRRKRAGISYRKNPVSMIFAGPSGVGKTELVKVLADELFKEPESLIRLDMSEFMEKHSVSRIIGAPPGYVGFDEAGQLTEKIRRRPHAVILFDEIEKAHPDVMNILLQILDDGRITDAQGRQVNFENSIIIMTTNAGSEVSSSISGFAESKEQKAKEKTERALAGFLRPEFMNRVDEIITFRHLDKRDFVSIADLLLSRLRDFLLEKGTKLVYSEEVLQLIADRSFSDKYGARNMRRFIERHVEDAIANIVIDNYGKNIIGIALSVKDGEIVVDIL